MQKRDDREVALVGRIRTAMEAANIDMTELAARSGIRYGTLRSYLAGDRAMPARAIVGLADARDVSPDWLVAGRPAALHPRSLLIAVALLERTIRSKPSEAPPALGDLMSLFYSTYKREYLNRFRNPTHVYASAQMPRPIWLC